MDLLGKVCDWHEVVTCSALQAAYPDHNWNHTKFGKLRVNPKPRGWWSETNQRTFLDQFALRHSIWYCFYDVPF